MTKFRTASYLNDKYLAIKLDDKSRQLLLAQFPPIHDRVYADHVTMMFTISIKQFFQDVIRFGDYEIEVVSQGSDERAQAVFVNITSKNCPAPRSSKSIRPDGKKFHITISTNSIIGKPVNSNDIELLTPVETPLILNGTLCLLQK